MDQRQSVPYHDLSDGNRMPAIGLGTCAVRDNCHSQTKNLL